MLRMKKMKTGIPLFSVSVNDVKFDKVEKRANYIKNQISENFKLKVTVYVI